MTFPWVQHYDPGVPPQVEPPTHTLPWLLHHAAARSPQSPALAFFGRTLSYAAVQDQVVRLANALKSLGLAPGERLAIILQNSPQVVISYYAALQLGAVVVMLNPLLSPQEMADQLKDSGCRILVVLDHLFPKVEQILPRVDLAHIVVCSLTDYLPWPLKWLYPFKARRQGLACGMPPGPGRSLWRDLLTSAPLAEPPAGIPENAAVLQYTGGTTGVPKSAILTHKNLMTNVAQINAWLPQFRYGAERVVGVLPFFHAFGLTACLNWPLSQGAMVIILPRFDTRGFCRTLKKYRPTVLPGVPTLFVALLNHPPLARLDISSLWACISGSAPLPLEVRDRFEALTGCRILEGYGLTETSPVTHLNPYHGRRPPNCIGLPFPGTAARIVDPETGLEDVPVGQVGELILKGPQVMAGYWQKPEETALALRDGWLYTGDLARMDEQGYFYIVDRKKDLIINGGFKVFPREVEEVLYQHPQVKEAVALGVPDAYRGEIVKVVIVPRDDARLSQEELMAFLASRLAAYKLPKIIEFRSELPKSLVGKVLRRVLREEAAALQNSRA